MANASPRVYNKYHYDWPEHAVYIGRPSKWGNPFFVVRDGDRDRVVAKYREYIMNNTELLEAARRELRGKDLVCFCAPRACHGDVLLEIANGPIQGHHTEHSTHEAECAGESEGLRPLCSE